MDNFFDEKPERIIKSIDGPTNKYNLGTGDSVKPFINSLSYLELQGLVRDLKF
jgi:hypothetical protein